MQRDPAPSPGASSALWSLALIAGALFWALALVVALVFVVPVLAGTQVQVGFRDFDYGSAPTQPPTSEKPQSKLWWNDGNWWGCLWDPSAGAYRIHRFDESAHDWTSVGPDGDDRSDTLVDCLWNGTLLYIVSQEFNGSSASRLYSYDYDSGSGSYSLRSGFPVNVNDQGAEALTIDEDSTGKLWITWESGKDIWVNRTVNGDDDWGSKFKLPVQGNDTTTDDISAVARFDSNKIGILWSNQADQAVYFTYHVDGDPDTQWAPRETVLYDPGAGQVSDDHLNFALSCDPTGNLYAASKSGLSSGTDPQIYLSRRDPAGNWTNHVVVRKQDDWTRPALIIDSENDMAYIFAKSDDIESGAIHVKSASLSDLDFEPGTGTMFIQSDADVDINNPTSTKQCVNGTTGLLVIACDKGTDHYFHNLLDLQSAAAPDIAVAPGAYDFGTVEVGTPATASIFVRNDGNADLDVTSTTITGPSAPEFQITSGSGAFTVAAGESAAVDVEFDPAGNGTMTATLEIDSNDPTEAQVDVPLDGIGLDPATGVSIGPGGERWLVLETPRPNPRVGSVSSAFDFTLPHATAVTLRIYDVTGRLVATRPAQRFDAPGAHTIGWNPGSLAPGTYFVRLQTRAGGSATSPWIVLR